MSGTAAKRPSPAGKPGSAGTAPRPPGGKAGPRAPGKGPRRTGNGKGARLRAALQGRPGLPWWRRPLSIILILLALFVGLPVMQALFGELGAIMLGCLAAGFALGRATAR
ncbi:Hypothetical protein HVPorG_02692 [Roseomonas mucosa]|uniref:hypothetical protein n=1 Tax=Roseomonas mucosa TaxID=207340 RepID=UPI0022059D36|nr:hypothetical protein [Roseomonas mucosa]QDJ10905.1 Hypothetical protein HVPorG_02692 [Roseomonas mucosa]